MGNNNRLGFWGGSFLVWCYLSINLVSSPVTQAGPRDQLKIEARTEQISDIPLGHAPNPFPVEFDKNGQQCQDLIHATHCLCNKPLDEELVKVLLDGVEYISFDEFNREMHKSLEQFLEKIGKLPFVVIYNEGKSTQWLTQKYGELLPAGQFIVREMMTLRNVLKTHPNHRNVVIIDDALYSGGQMFGISSYVRQMCLTCRFHAIVPFASKIGRQTVEASASATYPVFLYSGREIETVEERIKKNASNPQIMIKHYKEIFGKNLTKSHTFFQHKIGDEASTTRFLRAKNVFCSDPLKFQVSAKDAIREVAIPCVPFIQTPYKSRANLSVYDPANLEPFKEDFQKAIQEMRSYYDSNRCEDWRHQHPEFNLH